MELQGIFLDMYGTLADGDKAAVEAVCAHIVEQNALPISAPALAIDWGNRFFAMIATANGPDFKTLYEIELITLSATARELGVSLDPRPYADELRRYWCTAPLHAEVHAALAGLPRPVCIVSNADRDDVAAALRFHGLAHLPFVTSECARSYKPDAAIFEMALNKMGWDARRVVHVGDSLHSDVGGAQPLGLKTAWVARENRIHDIGALEPDRTLADLGELVNWLRDGATSATSPAAGRPCG